MADVQPDNIFADVPAIGDGTDNIFADVPSVGTASTGATMLAYDPVGEQAEDVGAAGLAGAGIASGTLGIYEAIYRTPDALKRIFIDLPNELLDKGIESLGLDPKTYNPRVKVGINKLVNASTAEAEQFEAWQQRLAQENPAFRALMQKSQTSDQAVESALHGDLGPLGQVLADPGAWAAFIGQAAPSLAASALSGGSLKIIAWLEGMEGANTAEDFEQRTGVKLSPDEYARAVGQVAVINGVLEKAGLDQLLHGRGKNYLLTLLKNVTKEGGTEFLQTLNSNAAAQGYDETVKLLEGALQSLMGGAGLGAAASPFTHLVPEPQEHGQGADASVGQPPPTLAAAQAGEDTRPGVPEADLVRHAQSRLRELETKAGGTPDATVPGPDGLPMQVRGEPARILNQDEKDELDYLRENIDSPEALANAYGVRIDESDAFDQIRPDEDVPAESEEDVAPQAADAVTEADRQDLTGQIAETERLIEESSNPVVRERLRAERDRLKKELAGEPLTKQERKASRTHVRPAKDTLVTAIQKLGGIDTELENDWHGRLRERKDKTPGLVGLERPGKGRSLDALAESLHELGYLKAPDASELAEQLERIEHGESVYSIARDEQDMVRDFEASLGARGGTEVDAQRQAALEEERAEFEEALDEYIAEGGRLGELYDESGYDEDSGTDDRWLHDIAEIARGISPEETESIIERGAISGDDSREIAHKLIKEVIYGRGGKAQAADQPSGAAPGARGAPSKPDRGRPGKAKTDEEVTETPSSEGVSASGPKKPAPEAPLRIEDYSEKAIIVRGQTRENIDRIKAALPGRRPLWNKKAGGWIFPKAREAEVRKALADLLGPEGTGMRTTVVDLREGTVTTQPYQPTAEPPVTVDVIESRGAAASNYRPGDRVEHETGGPATVVGRERDNLRIELDRGGRMAVDARKLRRLAEPTEPKAEQTPETPSAPPRGPRVIINRVPVTDYQEGDFVRVSDGTPRPPERNKRQLSRWEANNFTGYVHRIESDGRVLVDRFGTGTIVQSIDPRERTITREAAPDQPPDWFTERTQEGRRQLALEAGVPEAEASRISKMNWPALRARPELVGRLEQAALAAPEERPEPTRPGKGAKQPEPELAAPREGRETDAEAFRAALERNGVAINARGSIFYIRKSRDGRTWTYQRRDPPSQAVITSGPGGPGEVWSEAEAIDEAVESAFPRRPPPAAAPQAPEGFEVDSARKSSREELAGGALAYTAVARRLRPWKVERGFGDTPEAAQADALRRVGAGPEQRGAAPEPKETQRERLGIAPKTEQTELTEADEFDEIFDAALDEQFGPSETPAPAQSDTERLARAFAEAFRSGRRFGAIIEARHLAEQVLGRPVRPGSPEAKALEEAVEAGLVLRAREIAAEGLPAAETYDRLVALYQAQPLLAERTSSSIERQAYSTPAPLAYLASRLARIGPQTQVYEPTAGNGMLVMEARPENITANEVNPERAANLRMILGEAATLTERDAIEFAPEGAFEVVIANPPFGKVRDGDRTRMFDIDGLTTPEADHGIAWRALKQMLPDGRAVLIIGSKKGDTDARRKGYRSFRTMAFMRKLYDNYNVVDHFTVDGRLYERQGAGWPVDVIVIDGRGRSALTLPMREPPPISTSWDELRSKLDDRVDTAGQLPGAGDHPPAAPAAPGAEPAGVRAGARREDRPDDQAGEPGARPKAPADRGGQGKPGGGRQPGRRGGAAGGEQPVAPGAGGVPAGSGPGTPSARPGGEAGPAGGAAGGVPGDTVPGVERPASEAATSAAGNIAMGLDEVSAGLAELFGGPGRLGSGPTFDEQTYAKAKPYFLAGVKHFKAAGRDITDMVKALVRHLAEVARLPRQAIEAMRPYVRRFVEDVRAGRIRLDEQQDTPPKAPRAPNRRENTEAETAFQIRYQPTSNARFAVGTLVPRNMQTAMSRALAELSKRVGDIDEYVAGKLGYSLDELLGTENRPGYFSAEQVDALALAIDNVEDGGAFIIGDQTGVGKGRFVAAMLRYGLENNKTPVFLTKDPGLYADMVRDLRDIGMLDIHGRILVTNNELRGGKVVPLSEDASDVLAALPKAKQHAAIRQIAASGNLPEGFDMLFTTYSQMQYAPGGEMIDRQSALLSLAPNSIIVLDESHEAGGSETRKISPKTGEPIPTRADFIRQVLQETQGAIYSSATYAKNPTVMSLYFKTDLSMAVERLDELAETISAGGVPLQQVVANMLVEAGQYARRERSFEGVEMNLDVLPTDLAQANRSAEVLRAVFTLDADYMEGARVAFIEEMEAQGEKGGRDAAVGEGSAGQTGFANVMHNVIAQMLLALKAPAVVDKALALARAGEKPIIALSNTNGSIIKDYIRDDQLTPGDRAEITFNSIMDRYLRRLRRITLKDADGKITRIFMSDAQIREFGGEDALAQYRAVERAIAEADLSAMPASPVDYILDRLNAAGVKTDEITGRSVMIRNGVYEIRQTSPAGKKKVMNAYNAGRLDALVINRSGATGFSLHATDKPNNDGKPRHMIVLQPDSNIDVFMQMLGRIHRTGQIKLPRYTIGVSDLAVEKRLAAVLMRKMASLNANTTASKRSAVSLDNVTDFMNKYGDEVVADFLRENTEIANITNVRPGGMLDGIAARLTGRLAILDAEQVNEIYEQIERNYREYIESLDRMGMNALEAKTLDLDARTSATQPLVSGRENASGSPFAEAAVIETVDVRKLGKPYTVEELQAEIRAAYGEHTDSSQYVAEQHAAIDAKMPGYRAGIEANLERTAKAVEEAKTDKQRERAGMALFSWQGALEEADGKLHTLKGMVETYRPGTAHILTIRQGEAEQSVHAVALGVDIRAVRENPTAASAYKVRFAIADPGREVRVPLSKFLGDEPAYSTDAADYDAVTNAFREGGQEARESRQIITGNLVSGYAKFKRGQIVMFTDDQGNNRQGILMPREFNAQRELDRLPVQFETAEQMARFLMDEPGRRIVKTEDGIANITFNDSGFQISINVRGGKPYYLNQAVRNLIGEFQSRRGQKVMRATIGGSQTLAQVFDVYRENLGARFVATAHKDEARAIVNEGKEADEPRFALRRDSTETPAFKRWFGDSKVVDENGEPLVVYHGTRQDFDAFDSGFSSPRIQDQGFHFTADAHRAGRFAEGESANIMPGYLSLQNPMRAKSPALFNRQLTDALGKYANTEQIANWLESQGYDGVQFGEDHFIVFRPEQIKSAVGNRGTFDPDSADIRQRRGEGSSAEPLAAEAVKSHLNAIARGWKGRPPIVVVQSESELPDNLRQAIRRGDTEGQVRGVYFAGRAYIIADNNDDLQEAEETLLHEVLGHFGLRGLLGEAIAPVMRDIYRAYRNHPRLLEIVKRYRLDVSQPGDQATAGEEMLAHMVQTGGRPGLLRRVIAKIRAFLSAHFPRLALDWSDADIWALIERARSFVENGNMVRGEPVSEPRFALGGSTIVGRAGNGEMAAVARHSGGRWHLVVYKNGNGELFPQGTRRFRLSSAAEVMRTLESFALIGDYSEPRATTLRARPLFEAGFTVPADALKDRFIYQLQDRFVDLKRIQGAITAGGGRVDEASDAYMREALYYGRAEKRIADFRSHHVEPLLKQIKASGLTLEEVNDYLYARHAPERNAEMARINPQIDEGEGSGMTDDEAELVMQHADDAGKLPALERVALEVDRIVEKSRRLMVNAGLEREENVRAWETTYQHYVPLRGFEESDEAAVEASGAFIRGRGFDTRGREKAAFGRRSRAANVLVNVMAQYESVAVRAEKNRVGQSLLRLVQANPNPEFWQINPVEYRPRRDPQTGLVMQARDMSYRAADNVLVVKIDGKDRHIRFNGDRGERMAKALKNLDMAGEHVVIDLLGRFNRILAALSTSWNPEFILTNFVRDIQTAALNLSDTQVQNAAARIWRDVAHAMAGIVAAKRGKNTQWARHFEAFERRGGKTGWVDAHQQLSDVQREMKRYARELERSRGDPRELIKKLARAIGGSILAANEVVENGVRLSAFVNAQRLGMSPDRAAYLAKNLTVNFNRRGSLGRKANALYLFFNAAMQGSARIIQVLGSPRGRRVALALVTIATIQDIANRLLSGSGDDDDEPLYDKAVPDYVKERNWVFMTPDGDYVKVPLPYGWNVFKVAGDQIGRAISARMGLSTRFDSAEALTTLGSAAMGAFNPLGAEVTSIQSYAPTFIRPGVQIATNEDWAGRPIYPEPNPFSLAPDPDSQLKWDSTNPLAVAIADALNRTSGGSSERPGLVDVSPNTLMHLSEFLGGGLARFVSDGSTALWATLAEGKEVEDYQIPFKRRVFGSPSDRVELDLFYNNVRAIEYAAKDLEAARRKGDYARARDIRREYTPELRFAGSADRALQQLRTIRRQIKHIEASGRSREDMKPRIDRLRKRMDRVVQGFNKQYRRATVD